MILKKQHRVHARPFLFACSVLALSFAACNSSPDSQKPTIGITSPVTPTPASELPLSPTPVSGEEQTPAPEVSVPLEPTTALPTATPEPTPGPDSYLPEIASGAVRFSVESGFYAEPFSVALSAEAELPIYFTTDGSDPRTSETAMLYTGEIPVYDYTSQPNVLSAYPLITLCGYLPPTYEIDKGMVLRAVTKQENGTFGPLTANTYFVGRNASYYQNLTVLSLVTDSSALFDPDTGIYVIGSGYYQWRNSPEYFPYNPDELQNPTNYNKKGAETEIPVFLQVFRQGKLSYFADLGARIAGNYSRSFAQKSLRLYARKEYGPSKMEYNFFPELTDSTGKAITSFDKLTIRNGGNDNQSLHFRDVLLQDLVSQLSFDTMAAEPCVLFLNGEFWGFYMLREKIDDDYIQSHYGLKKKDIAIIKNGDVETGTEADLTEFRELCAWAAGADMTDAKNYERFCAFFDVQNFMDYMTIQTYLCNSDFAYGGMNNWQVWHSRETHSGIANADTRWRFIVFDLDYSAGLNGGSRTSYEYDTLGEMHSTSSDFNLPAILKNLCKNDAFRQAFYENYLRILNTCFAPDTVCAKIDAYVREYEEVTRATFLRFGLAEAAAGYGENVAELKNFFQSRPNYAIRYLTTYCGLN